MFTINKSNKNDLIHPKKINLKDTVSELLFSDKKFIKNFGNISIKQKRYLRNHRWVALRGWKIIGITHEGNLYVMNHHHSYIYIYINIYIYIYALQGDSDLAEIDYANTFQKKWLICSSMNMRNTLWLSYMTNIDDVSNKTSLIG